MNDAGIRQELQVMAKLPVARLEPGIGTKSLGRGENRRKTHHRRPGISRGYSQKRCKHMIQLVKNGPAL